MCDSKRKRGYEEEGHVAKEPRIQEEVRQCSTRWIRMVLNPFFVFKYVFNHRSGQMKTSCDHSSSNWPIWRHQMHLPGVLLVCSHCALQIKCIFIHPVFNMTKNKPINYFTYKNCLISACMSDTVCTIIQKKSAVNTLHHTWILRYGFFFLPALQNLEGGKNKA